MVEMTIVRAVNTAIAQEMERDKKVMLLGEDVGQDGGVFRATEGLLKKFGANRVVDTPLSESGIVGAAIGLAVAGMKPIAEIQFEGFIYPALDQIVSHAAKIRNRSRGKYSVPLVVRAPWGGGIHAPEHHSESPEAYFAHTPGLKVVIPSTPYDTKGLLVSAIRDPDPVIFFEPKRIYRSVKQEVPKKEYWVPIGKAQLVQTGKEVTVISWGSMVRECVKGIKESGVSCDLIDLRTLAPLDREAINKSVDKTGRVVIVHEAPKTGGFGAEVSASIAEDDILDLEAPIVRVCGYDVPMPLLKLENAYLPDPGKIAKAIKKTAEF